MVKTCSRCREQKQLDAFYPDRSRRDGRGSTCRECAKAYQRERRLDPALLERHRAYMREYSRAHAEERKAERRLVRLEMIQAYGGRCECCGETYVEFLTMDHVGGWGREHRAQTSSASGRLPHMLKAQGWPREGFRLLCWNCNCARGIHGYCPHGEPA